MEPRGCTTSTDRGRGLPIMHSLMDAVEVTHTEDGTTVQLRRALRA